MAIFDPNIFDSETFDTGIILASTITIQLTEVCAGGNHLHFSVTGMKSLNVHSDIADMESGVTDEEAAAFCKVLARMAKANRTQNQAKTILQTGVTVTV